jgi:hypothetical protein
MKEETEKCFPENTVMLSPKNNKGKCKMKSISIKTFTSTFAFFGFTYMLLVITNRVGKIPYFFAGIVLLFTGITLFLRSEKIKENAFKRNLCGIFSCSNSHLLLCSLLPTTY